MSGMIEMLGLERTVTKLSLGACRKSILPRECALHISFDEGPLSCHSAVGISAVSVRRLPVNRLGRGLSCRYQLTQHVCRHAH